MVKGAKSLSAQVGIDSFLHRKVRMILLLISLFVINIFSAQETQAHQPNTSEAVISVVGNAVIYSKDASFNKQIRDNKNLVLNSKIEIAGNSALKITAKKQEKKAIPAKTSRKKESIVIAAKEEKEKKYSADLPKKVIDVKIDSKDISTQFSSGFSASHVSFIPPNNDSSPSKFLVEHHLFQDRISTKFQNTLNYYYKNRNPKQWISIYKLSVRPPPVQLI